LFEAARWGASCFNEQPWRFVVATKENPEQFDRLLATLMPKNQEWAKTAWALGITVGKKTFTHNSSPNRFGLHDTGAALANLMIQATAVEFMSTGWADLTRERHARTAASRTISTLVRRSRWAMWRDPRNHPPTGPGGRSRRWSLEPPGG